MVVVQFSRSSPQTATNSATPAIPFWLTRPGQLPDQPAGAGVQPRQGAFNAGRALGRARRTAREGSQGFPWGPAPWPHQVARLGFRLTCGPRRARISSLFSHLETAKTAMLGQLLLPRKIAQPQGWAILLLPPPPRDLSLYAVAMHGNSDRAEAGVCQGPWY